MLFPGVFFAVFRISSVLFYRLVSHGMLCDDFPGLCLLFGIDVLSVLMM